MAQRQSNGEAIRALRESLGIKQEDLAGRCGISQGSLSNIESGTRNASPEVIVRLAKWLGVGVGAITSFPEPAPEAVA
jgi:transcriptional regulator with XRE-family HTH domain